MGVSLVGDQCYIPQKLLDDEIFSASHRIIKVEVGTEWLVVDEEVVQYTPCKLTGLVCCHDVSSNGECVCDIVREIKCFLNKVALLCALGMF